MRVQRRTTRHEVIILFTDPEDLQRWGSTALTRDTHLTALHAHAAHLRALGIPYDAVAFDGSAYLAWLADAPDTGEARELWARSVGPRIDL